MELIDIVDEDNDVIGQLPIGEAYRRRAIKRQAGVIIFRTSAKDEMLLQLRSKYHKSMPNRWSIVSGVMSAGETPRACIERELVEEMFHEITDPPKIEMRELFLLRKNADDDPAFLMLFEGFYDGEFSLDPHEAAGWTWMKVDDVKEDVMRNPEKYTGTFLEIMSACWKRR